ncbi:MAG: LysR family transcriptional regulator [Pseudomonadota bacterium]
MKVKSKFWLEDDAGETIFGEGRRKILELIDELGSMQATAKALNMSYRGVWARIKATEERLGMKLVETSVGRGKDRGSKLTPEAKTLLHNYKALNKKGNAHADELYDSIFLGRGGDMAPVVPSLAVVGRPGSGTEELAAALVAILSSRGRKAAVITTSEAPGEKTDGERKVLDGGAAVVIRTHESDLTFLFPDHHELTHEAIAANYALGCDLTLVLSEERLHLPTLELFRRDLAEELITRKSKHILAVVGDPPPGKKEYPHFSLEQLGEAVDLIETRVLSPSRPVKVSLLVDGRRTPMLPFVEDIFFRAVTGMVSSLKSCEQFREIELSIKNYDEKI